MTSHTSEQSHNAHQNVQNTGTTFKPTQSKFFRTLGDAIIEIKNQMYTTSFCIINGTHDEYMHDVTTYTNHKHSTS